MTMTEWVPIRMGRGSFNREGAFFTIRTSGSSTMSADAFEMMEEPEALMFFYDRNTGLLGVRSVKRGTKGSVRVSSPPSRTSYHQFSGAAIASSYGLDGPTRFVYCDQDDQTFIFRVDHGQDNGQAER